MDSQQPAQSRISLIRVMMVSNFVILLALVGPGSSHQVDLFLRRFGIANLITIILQLWFVGSTLFVTSLTAWRLRKPKMWEGWLPPIAKLDWLLLFAWWLIIILLCLYAFMMGMGG